MYSAEMPGNWLENVLVSIDDQLGTVRLPADCGGGAVGNDADDVDATDDDDDDNAIYY